MKDIIIIAIIATVLVAFTVEIVNVAFRHPEAAIWTLTVIGTAAAFVAAFVFLPLLK